jgi:hypothetical protein
MRYCLHLFCKCGSIRLLRNVWMYLPVYTKTAQYLSSYTHCLIYEISKWRRQDKRVSTAHAHEHTNVKLGNEVMALERRSWVSLEAPDCGEHPLMETTHLIVSINGARKVAGVWKVALSKESPAGGQVARTKRCCNQGCHEIGEGRRSLYVLPVRLAVFVSLFIILYFLGFLILLSLLCFSWLSPPFVD